MSELSDQWREFAKDYLAMKARIAEAEEKHKLRDDENLSEWGLPLLGKDGNPIS